MQLAGRSGADVMLADCTAPSHCAHGGNEARLSTEHYQCKCAKHVLKGSSRVPLLIPRFGTLRPSPEACLENVADVAF